jgi:regulation of enolase protein 1 (concanavalin A-like superfamily)
MVEATGGKINWNDGSESDHTWLMRGIQSNYTRLWDANSATKGYFDKSNTSWTNKWGKGFTPTVDGITTHALLMALMYDSLNHKQRLVELADNITDRMVSNMSISAAAFPEVYNSDWSIDYNAGGTEIGHAYKTSWVLARAFLLNPSRTQYRTAAQAIMQNLWEKGAYDTIYGGPYSSLYWQSGVVYNTNKNHWMIEQGVTSGLINYYLAQTQAQRDMYLRVADGSMNFFINHMMDNVYGEFFSDVSRDGSTIVNADKGGLFTAGYHSIELAYYVYLYSSLYYHKTPVQLYYKMPSETLDRNIKLTPIAIEDSKLKILDVTLDGVPYTDYNRDTRTVHLPPSVGGKLKVTFGLSTSAHYTINATAGEGGTISPAGSVSVNEGASQTFTISPSAGYHISNVSVNGSSVGSVTTYTFKNVTSNNSITAQFARNALSITASATAGGTILPSGTVNVAENGSQTFTISANTGYTINSVIVDGVSIGAVSTHSFTNITSSHTISASFTPVNYTFTATAGNGGSISPSGSVTVPHGASQTFTISPSAGYRIDNVLIDGVSAGSVSSYVFNSVNGPHSITAQFSVIPSQQFLHRDIGTPSIGGSYSENGGTITINGSGNDIWSTSDQFQFAYRQLTGDMDIVVKVASVEQADIWSKAGVMIRESLEAGSKNAMIAVTPQLVTFQRRTSVNASTSSTKITGITAPRWIRLVRSGTTITGYHSSNGTSWTKVASASVSMNTTVYAGLCVTAHTNSRLCKAVFESITITQ